jgi:hypothetical protein
VVCRLFTYHGAALLHALTAGTYGDDVRALDQTCKACSGSGQGTNSYTEEEGSDAPTDCNGECLCSLVSLLGCIRCELHWRCTRALMFCGISALSPRSHGRTNIAALTQPWFQCDMW